LRATVKFFLFGNLDDFPDCLALGGFLSLVASILFLLIFYTFRAFLSIIISLWLVVLLRSDAWSFSCCSVNLSIEGTMLLIDDILLSSVISNVTFGFVNLVSSNSKAFRDLLAIDKDLVGVSIYEDSVTSFFELSVFDFSGTI
jgi:hypothetical protein